MGNPVIGQNEIAWDVVAYGTISLLRADVLPPLLLQNVAFVGMHKMSYSLGPPCVESKWVSNFASHLLCRGMCLCGSLHLLLLLLSGILYLDNLRKV